MEKYLQLSFVFLLTLAASLLCLGQESFIYPIVVLVLSSAGFTFVDQFKWFQLNRFWLNFLTLLAAVYSLYEMFFSGMPFEQVVGAANLLVNIELILLFRRKTVHLYWQLILLSFLQVIVGAAFRQQLEFGLLLGLYLISLLISSSLLVFWRERQTIAGIECSLPLAPSRIWPTLTLSQKILVFLGSSFRDEYLCFQRQDNILRPVESDVRTFPLGWAWHVRLLGLSSFSIVVCVLFFLLMPRFGEGSFLGFRSGRLPRIGFTDTIRLGELGPLKTNKQPVCRVLLWEGMTNEIYPKSNQLYLRGQALNWYENRTWTFRNNRTQMRYYDNPLPFPMDFNPAALTNPNLVRCEYHMQASQRPETFTVSPFFPIQPGMKNDYLFSSKELKLFRKNHVRTTESAFSLGTFALQKSVQVEITPVVAAQTVPPLLQLPENEQNRLLVPTARELAQTWLKEVNLSVEKDGYYKCALHLERMLKISGRYKYSLSNPQRKRYLDPVEDFLAENRVGHCEYFASALVLMLRSVGIPSEVVVGYFCDEYNTFGHFFQVRQLHAHAWAEVWLPPEQLPGNLSEPDGPNVRQKSGTKEASGADSAHIAINVEDANSEANTDSIDSKNSVSKVDSIDGMDNVNSKGDVSDEDDASSANDTAGNDDEKNNVIMGSFDTYRFAWPEEQWRLGGWLRLDPTPDSSLEEEEISSVMDRAGKFLDWVNLLWKNYVVEMNAPRQQTAIYTPVWDSVQHKLNQWFGQNRWRKPLFRFWRALRRNLGPGTVLLFLIGVGALRWSYKKWKRRPRQTAPRKQSVGWTEAQLSSIAFYRQLELRLKKWGWVRRASQTPRQFVRLVEQNCPEARTESEQMEQTVDRYYQVRFGTRK